MKGHFLTEALTDGGSTGDPVHAAPSLAQRVTLFEFNAVAASSIAVAALAIDALSALPATSQKDIPASLRCSSMVLVAMLASPVMESARKKQTRDAHAAEPPLDYELPQRGVLLLLLLVTATLGEAHGEAAIRVADARFTLVAGWSTLALYVLRSSSGTPGSTLVAALLFYLGVRITRAAVNHSAEVVSFTVSSELFESRGYALADAVAATAIGFGGCITACCGVAIVVNDRAIAAYGSTFAAPMVAQLSGFAFAAALIAQLSVYSRIDDLDVIFSDSSCGGDYCDAALRARRLYVANSATGPLWAGVVAMTVFSTPKDRRTSGAFEHYFGDSRVPTSGGLVGALATVAIVAASVLFSGGELAYASTELVVLYCAIPTLWFLSAPLGCVLYLVGNMMCGAALERGALQRERFRTHALPCAGTSKAGSGLPLGST